VTAPNTLPLGKGNEITQVELAALLIQFSSCNGTISKKNMNWGVTRKVNVSQNKF
jgi:hypothetical protein